MVSRPECINELDFSLLNDRYKDEDELQYIIEKIKNDYPVQYAIGNVEFLDNKILVDERVLVPRFETELLVSKLIRYIESFSLDKSNMLDLCTGSGCIAIALKKRFKEASIKGLDVSDDALELARENAKVNNTDVLFFHTDILKDNIDEKEISVIISNPPYVKKDEFVTPNTKFEPDIALYPGEDDTIFYKRILDQSKKMLMKKNIIAFEIGSTQAKVICDYARKVYPDARIVVEKDYALFDRFIFIFNECE